jgi:hypothetical protein
MSTDSLIKGIIIVIVIDRCINILFPENNEQEHEYTHAHMHVHTHAHRHIHTHSHRHRHDLVTDCGGCTLSFT